MSRGIAKLGPPPDLRALDEGSRASALVAYNLRRLRIENGLRLEAISQKTGIALSQVSDIELARRNNCGVTVRTLFKIIDAIAELSGKSISLDEIRRPLR